MGKTYRTDFLFATPTFLGGVGSIMDMGGRGLEFNSSETPAQADALALRADFGVVGEDIKSAIKTIANE